MRSQYFMSLYSEQKWTPKSSFTTHGEGLYLNAHARERYLEVIKSFE